MSMPSIDPGDYTQEQLTSTDPIPSAPATECDLCGEDFNPEKLQRRQSEKNPGVCLGCARLEQLELTPDESDALAEQYWSRRYDA